MRNLALAIIMECVYQKVYAPKGYEREWMRDMPIFWKMTIGIFTNRKHFAKFFK